MMNVAHSKIVKGSYQVTAYDWGLRVEALDDRPEPLYLDRIYLAALGYAFAGLERDDAGTAAPEPGGPELRHNLEATITTLEHDLQQARAHLVELKRLRKQLAVPLSPH